MHAPVNGSNPFLAIARHHGVDYGVVLNFADWLKAGGTRGPDTVWQFQARQALRAMPQDKASPCMDDVVETCRRLGHIEPLTVNPDE